jgi:hypothetical protein
LSYTADFPRYPLHFALSPKLHSIDDEFECFLASTDFDGFGVLTSGRFIQYNYLPDGSLVNDTKVIAVGGYCGNVAARGPEPSLVSMATTAATTITSKSSDAKGSSTRSRRDTSNGLPPGCYVLPTGGDSMIYLGATHPVTSVYIPFSFPATATGLTVIPGERLHYIHPFHMHAMNMLTLCTGALDDTICICMYRR